MSRRDISVVKGGGPVRVHDVDDRTTSGLARAIYAGEPIKSDTPATAGEFAIPVAAGDPEVGTDILLGIPSRDSDETSTADGEIEYITLLPNRTVIRGKGTTAGNIDTAAELLALKGHWVCFDDTSSVYSIDENEATDPNVHGLQIIGGDIVKGTLDCVVSSLCTQGGTTI